MSFYLLLKIVGRQVHELKMEKKKADALTYQMLPPTVARVAIVMPCMLGAFRLSKLDVFLEKV